MMYEMDVSIISGQLALIHVKLEPGEGFEVYGGTSEDGLRVEQQSDGEWLVTLDEQDVGRRPLVRFNLYARQISSGREWVVLGGKILVAPRTADVPGDKLAPVEYCITIPVVENVVDLTGAQIVTGIVGPRGYSAYEIAVMEGFEGTEEEWLENMRQQTATLAVEQVTPLMERAETAAGDAEQFAADASNSLAGAKSFARGAEDEADRATAAANKAAQHEDTVCGLITYAAAHEQAAAQSAKAALAAQQGAEKAKQDAQKSQAGAEQAKTDAESAKVEAQTAETNAKSYADKAAADKAAAEKAKQDAQAAQAKAEQEAVKAEGYAGQLGDAALKSGNNTFTGSNVFNGAISGNGTLCGMPFGVAFGAASMYQGLRLSAEEFMQLFPNYAEMEVWPGLDCLSTNMASKSMPKLKYVYCCLTQDYYVSAPSGIPSDNWGKLEEIVLYHSGNGWIQASIKAYAQRNVILLPEYNNISYGKGFNIYFRSQAKMSDTFIYAPILSKINFSYEWDASKGSNVVFLGKQVFQEIACKGSNKKDAPMTIKGFNSPNCVRVQLTNCTLDKASILGLIGALPAYDEATMTDIPTCELYINPDLQGDAEVEEALLNLQTAVEDGGLGWTLAITGITLGGATTFALRQTYYYARREAADGSYIDADGQRWDVSGGTTVLRNYEANEEVAGYSAFLSLDDALAEWGLHEITEEERKADYERRYGAAE